MKRFLLLLSLAASAALAQVTIPWTDVDKTGSSLANLATRSASDLNSGTLPAARLPAFTGDATASPGTGNLSLATVNSNVGSFGSGTQIPVVTINGKGLITGASVTTVTPAWSSVTGKPTTVSGYGFSDVSAFALSLLDDADAGTFRANIGADSATNLTGGTLPAARLPAFTGDATSSAGASALTLATVNSNVGSFGSGTQIPVVTVNGKGLVTAVSPTTVTPAWSSITGKPTTVSGYGITDGALVDLSTSGVALRRERMRANLRAFIATGKNAHNYGAWAPDAVSVPTITQGASTSISSGYTVSPVTDAMPGSFNLLGGSYRKLSESFPGYNAVRAYGLDSTFGQLLHQMEFMTNASAFEIIHIQGAASGSLIRAFVDGRLVDPYGTVLTGGAGAYPRHVTYTFSTARVRHIRIELPGGDFAGVRIPDGSDIWPVELRHNRRPRCIVVGDSFTEGTGAAAFGNNFANRLGQATGWEVWASGSGGTGYLNPGPNARKKFRDRVQTDVIAQRPDIVIFAGGINDSAYTKSQIETEAGLLFDTTLAGLPNATIVAIGPWNPSATASSVTIDIRDAIKAAADARGVLFVDNIARSWIDANNKQSFHPSGLTATATATITGDAVTSATITSGGNGYSGSSRIFPVTFSGGGGSGAAGTVVLDGRVQSATVFAGGRGYDGTTTVTISGGGGTGATATATVVDGAVTGITITAAGTGYTSQPTITINGPAGSGGALATAAWTHVVTGITITSGGSGYTTAPTITLPAPADATHPNDAGQGYLSERLYFELPQANVVPAKSADLLALEAHELPLAA